MTLNDVKTALLTVSPDVYHHVSPDGQEPPYIVWAEDGQSEGLYGDGKIIKQVIEGTIDLFTKQEYDPLFSEIQGALNNYGVGFWYSSKQYEEETGITHFEWVWNIGTAVE